MRARRTLLTALLITVVATVASAGGYVVILKNGHKIRAKEPLEIQGHNAIITLAEGGTVTSFPLNQVDLVETERYNQMGLGDALLIEELSLRETPRPTPTPERPLGSMASLSNMGSELKSAATPTPTPTPGISLKGHGFQEPRVTQAFTQIFDERGLYLYRTSGGTKPQFFFVQLVTDSEREVFKALKVVSEAYSVIHELHPDVAPEAVELEMVQTSGKPAGTFRIAPGMADQLVSGETSVEQFYVQNVIF